MFVRAQPLHHKFSCSVAIYLFIGKIFCLFVFVLIFAIYHQNCDKKKLRFGNEFRFKYFLGLCPCIKEDEACECE